MKSTPNKIENAQNMNKWQEIVELRTKIEQLGVGNAQKMTEHVQKMNKQNMNHS